MPHPPPDPLTLYDLCVQNAPAAVRFIDAVRGSRVRGKAITLREDFSGGGGLSLAWVKSSPRRRAIAVDHDAAVLRRLNDEPRIRSVVADVRKCPAKADVIAATNFPLGYFHDRPSLVSYLKLVKKRLNQGGVFVADMYGGPSAFRTTTQRRSLELPDGTPVRYEFEQREADALTGLVTNALHFTVGKGKAALQLRDAFTYHWRLWSLPELADAFKDAGFPHHEFHDFDGGALDAEGHFHTRAISHGDELEANWVVYAVGFGDGNRSNRRAR